MKSWEREINIAIAILTMIAIVFAIRVFFDIIGTGVIMEEVSPDGKYEVVISRKKHPETFSFSEDLCTIELYEIGSGRMISCMENETELKPIQSYPTIKFIWLDKGLYIRMEGDTWYGNELAEYILPYK